MPADLFEATHCDRCGGELGVRKMSWFTEETICLPCSKWEDRIIDARLERRETLEGIGFVPETTVNPVWGTEPTDA